MPFLFFDCVLINCDRLVITIGLNSGPGVQNHANLFPKQLSMTIYTIQKIYSQISCNSCAETHQGVTTKFNFSRMEHELFTK